MIPDSSQDEKIIEKLNEFDYWFDVAEDGSSLQVKIVFEHPDLVSMGQGSDKIALKFNVDEFNKYAYFEAADGRPITLPLDFEENAGMVILTVDVQETQDEEMKSLMTAQSATTDNMQNVLLINIVISYISNSAMS